MPAPTSTVRINRITGARYTTPRLRDQLPAAKPLTTH